MKKENEPQHERFDLTRYTMFYFAHILHQNGENMATALQPMRFDNSTWRILATLQYHDKLTIKEIAHTAVLERSFVGRLINKLEEQGLVVRRTPPEDRRAVTVSLTDKGRETFHDVLLPAALATQSATFANVSEEEMDAFFSVLSRALENVYRAGHRLPPL